MNQVIIIEIILSHFFFSFQAKLLGQNSAPDHNDTFHFSYDFPVFLLPKFNHRKKVQQIFTNHEDIFIWFAKTKIQKKPLFAAEC